MAKVKMCDRCGTLYKEYNTLLSSNQPNGIMFINVDTEQRSLTHDSIDLCPRCMEEVKKFVKGDEL